MGDLDNHLKLFEKFKADAQKEYLIVTICEGVLGI